MNSDGWTIDPKTGDYVLTNGRPVNTTSLELPAYYRLKIKRKTWMYSPNDQYGSDFYKVKKRNTTNGNALIESIASRALQPLIDSGRASTISVTTLQSSRTGVSLEADITDAQGNTNTYQFNSLGV